MQNGLQLGDMDRRALCERECHSDDAALAGGLLWTACLEVVAAQPTWPFAVVTSSSAKQPWHSWLDCTGNSCKGFASSADSRKQAVSSFGPTGHCLHGTWAFGRPWVRFTLWSEVTLCTEYNAVRKNATRSTIIVAGCPSKYKKSMHTLLISRSLHRVAVADKLFLYNIQHNNIRPACQATCIRAHANQQKLQKWMQNQAHVSGHIPLLSPLLQEGRLHASLLSSVCSRCRCR